MSKENSKEPNKQPENKQQPESEEKKENLQEQFEKLQAEKDDVFSRLQRVSAEFANYQKRSVKQISESIAYEKEHILKTLLPVLDNFDHTLVHMESIKDAADIVKGVKMVYDQFLVTLKTLGVEPISAAGEKFDPMCHQALTQRTEPDKEDQIILEVFRKGYKMGDRILRPAIVIVNKNQIAEPKEEETMPDSGSENGD
ncbi:MAG: nucleotide exchange factor GrpE [Planctomycetes bacterium GWF2_41_51]|nr:MAG: nucleotide exchange factor GrpE [Planctomycetes bacterium GWF2_41_51]HBG26364.1 nucleotide exchange factor GrpE [Phycisphaerales bacterium]